MIAPVRRPLLTEWGCWPLLARPGLPSLPWPASSSCQCSLVVTAGRTLKLGPPSALSRRWPRIKTIISDKVLLQLALVFCDQPTRVLTLGDIAQWTPGCQVQNTSIPTLGRVSLQHNSNISLKIFAGVLEILLTIAEQSPDEGREAALVNR